MCTSEYACCYIWMEYSVETYQTIQFSVLLKAVFPCFLLTFYLDDPPTDKSRVLKSPTIIILSIPPFRSVNKCFIYFDCPMLGVYALLIIVSY